MDYRREIDGLRALAVTPVILFHAGFGAFGGGYVGVDVFFVISGYLITSIILDDMRDGKFTIAGFYERRARRIFPALFFMMLVAMGLAWMWLLPSDLMSFSKSLLATSGFLSNVFFWSERGYFGTAVDLKPLIHTWSLAVEEQYYVFFPLLLLLVTRWRASATLWVLALTCAVSLAMSAWVTGVHADSAFFLLPTRLWELMIGSLLAVATARGTFAALSADRFAALREAGALVGVAMIAYAVFAFDASTPFPGVAALVPTVGTALVIACASPANLVGRVLGAGAIVFVGQLSYSAYLWHQPVFAFARTLAENEPSHLAFAALIAVSMLLAWASWKYVEAPFRVRGRFSRTAVFSWSAVFLAFFATAGVVGWKGQGFPERYEARDRQVLEAFLDGGDYVPTRFRALQFAEFDPDPAKKRVLVIGDSYGEDLVNALHESGLVDTVSVSTHRIIRECGNLMLERDFSGLIEPRFRSRCSFSGWYGDARLVERMRQADEIWLASSWRGWVVDLLPESVRNIESRYGKTVRVFGPKYFGDVTQKRALAMARMDPVPAVELADDFTELNRRLEASLPAGTYVDVAEMLCGSDITCRWFDERRNLLTFDGTHLTKAGAEYYGRKLREVPEIVAAVRRPNTSEVLRVRHPAAQGLTGR